MIYRVYWYDELNHKDEKFFMEKKIAMKEYKRISEEYLYTGIEKIEIKEKITRLAYTHSGEEK